jgi:hypothetical protein
MRGSPGELAFTSATILLAVLAAAAAAGFVAMLAVPGLLDRLRALPANPWWLVYREPGVNTAPIALWRIGGAAASALISIAATFRLRAIYRREPSPVLPFIMMFLFSLGLECLRAGIAALFALDAPVSISILLTRVIYWGRFVGMLSLLVAGLYCTDLKYRTFFVVAGVVLLVSFAMTAYIPLDRTVFLVQLTWKLGDEQSVWFVNLAIGILTILTGAAAALTRGGPRFVRLAIALALLVGSRELLFFAVQPGLLAAGIVAQGAGAILCLRAFTAFER